MLIHEIAAEQTIFQASDLIEVEDGVSGVSKKELMSKIIPMTALADLIVGGVSGIPARLGIGLANQQLFVNAAGDGLEYGYGSKVVTYTRDMTLADGDVAYTGAGFKPRSIIVLSKYIAGLYIGFGDISNTEWQVGLYGANLATTDYNALYLVSLLEDAAATKYQLASLKSMDADGCTLTWIKGGIPAAGSGNFIIMYFR